MASTYSSSLRLELMATGDQSGTWGDTTNTNLGTLLEQAITGYLSVAQGDTANLTLTTVNGGSDQARNAIVNVTGALTANRNVVVQTANKLYLIKNATTGGFILTVKTASGTGVEIAPNTSRWVYSDGTNVVDGTPGVGYGYATTATAAGTTTLTVGSAATQFFTGSTTQTLVLPVASTLTLGQMWRVVNNSTGAVTINSSGSNLVGTLPAATQALVVCILTSGTTAASWSYLEIVSLTGAETLTNKTLTSPVLNTPTVGTSLLPTTDDGAPLGSTTKEWSDLFLASGGVINWANGNVTLTHATGALAIGSGAFNYAATATVASATTTDIGAATSNSVIVSGTTTITGLGTVAAGVTREVLFSGALTLTYNATSLILPGTASITTAANDTAAFRSLGSGNWVCLWYKRANGNPITNTTKLAAIEALANASGALTNDGSGNFSYATSGGMTLLGTLTTTSGSTQSLTSLTLTSYKRLYLVVSGVSTSNTSGNVQINSNNITGTLASAANTWSGWVDIDLTTGTMKGFIVQSTGADGSTVAASSAITTASTTVTVTVSTGTFDAGSIAVYGVK